MKTLTIISLFCLAAAICGCASDAARVRALSREADQRFANIAAVAEKLPESAGRTEIISEAARGRKCVTKVIEASEGVEDKEDWLSGAISTVWNIVIIAIVVAVVAVAVYVVVIIRGWFKGSRLGELAAKCDWTGLVASGRSTSRGFEAAYRKRRDKDLGAT